MTKKIVSAKQRLIFESLSKYPMLIFAGGRQGYSANIVGQFNINSMANEDRLDMGDGTNHVHIDWSQIASYVAGEFHGEGVITFSNVNGESLFKLYNPNGIFREDVFQQGGSLL